MQFNEEIAEFIGSEGARLYIKERYGEDSAEMKRIAEVETDNAAYVAFIQELIKELDAVYKSDISREQKLQQKEIIIAAAKERFDIEYESRFISENYHNFSKININNAYLELYRLYYAGGGRLRELYEESGGNIRIFTSAAKTITRKGGDPLEQLRAALKK